MGSKSRHSSQILNVVAERERLGNRTFVEPFVGGANVLDKLDSPRLGADTNQYLIAMWQSVASGWLPRDDYTEEQYMYVKSHRDEDPTLTGYFGFALSYGGKWFGGWRRDSQGKRNYVQEAYRNAIKQFPKLIGVDFVCSDYRHLDIPPSSVIYCDPPYLGTTNYGDSINHDEFWKWCESKVRDGHSVYVSEYTAPDRWKTIWEKKVSSSLTKDTGSKKAVESLFVLEPVK